MDGRGFLDGCDRGRLRGPAAEALARTDAYVRYVDRDGGRKFGPRTRFRLAGGGDAEYDMLIIVYARVPDGGSEGGEICLGGCLLAGGGGEFES